MKTESIVGRAIFAGTVGLACLYTWYSFEAEGNDIAGIYLNALLFFGVPGYSLILLRASNKT